MSENIIELKNISKVFADGFEAVSDFNLEVKKGEFVGYGAMYRANEDITIGIMPVGYDDGIFRKSRGRYVAIKNKRYQLIGDIGMGMSAVKIDDSIEINDRVTLIGDLVPIKEVAKHNGTSIYEIMCNIGKNVPRVYKKDDEIIAVEEGK